MQKLVIKKKWGFTDKSLRQIREDFGIDRKRVKEFLVQYDTELLATAELKAFWFFWKICSVFLYLILNSAFAVKTVRHKTVWFFFPRTAETKLTVCEVKQKKIFDYLTAKQRREWVAHMT